MFIYNLDIEFDEILGFDFFEYYECVIDLKSKELKTNLKPILIHKVPNDICTTPDILISQSCSKVFN